MTNAFDDIALASPISFGYERFSDKSASWFIAKTLSAMLQDSQLEKNQVDGLAVSSFSLAPDTPASVCETLGIELAWLEHLPYGGASGIIAAKRAARTIQAGDANIIACIGGDTLAPTDFQDLVSNFSNSTKDASYPYAGGGPNLAFGLMTKAYMDKYQISREDFGEICIQQRYNANHCSYALMRDRQLSLADYLEARAVVDPLHLYDCVMPCAGADGFLVMHRREAERLGVAHVILRGAVERFNAFAEDPIQLRGAWSAFADDLIKDAGVQLSDLDLIESYDDYPVVVMLQLEGMGFCRDGSAADFIRANSMTFDGRGIPHNTSGGQLSVGQAGAAGGFLGIVEGVRQLLRRAGDNQVLDPKLALITGYGMVNYDRGLCASGAILSGKH